MSRIHLQRAEGRDGVDDQPVLDPARERGGLPEVSECVVLTLIVFILLIIFYAPLQRFSGFNKSVPMAVILHTINLIKMFSLIADRLSDIIHG